MDKCQYKTMRYCYGFTCIRCHCVWFYPHDVDPMVCNKCEIELEQEIELEKARKRMEVVRADRDKLKSMDEALKQYYYEPMKAYLDEQTPFIYTGTQKDTKDLFKPRKPQPIKRNRFWKR